MVINITIKIKKKKNPKMYEERTQDLALNSKLNGDISNSD